MAKKKILLLSDDLRMSSGVATMSKHLVLGTAHKYDWVQLGAAITHPEKGKIFDVSEDVKKITGIEDANVKIIPSEGYGNADMIRQLLMMEQPDAILHFTDPRYWIWLYDIEHEIRQTVPLLFYHIWDDLPDPKYNRDYYESCDWIGCISKQTYGITNRVWNWDKEKHWIHPKNWQISYVPHGINSDVYKPCVVPTEFKKSIFGDKEYDFIVFWNNRNIRRKQPIETILAFNEFRKSLPKEKQDKVCYVMHTQPIDENGTDLFKVVEHCAPDSNIFFTNRRMSDEEVNWLYNLADVTINVASNEGFGLATAESVMAGTPIIINVTGGMQDQCGFRDKETDKLFTADDYIKVGSLHKKDWEQKVTWGNWVTPIWPVRSAVGSVPTPYIFDDRIDYEEIVPKLKWWYSLGREKRKEFALQGREWMMGEGNLSHTYMCQSLIDGIESTFENWKPRKKHQLISL
jgi:glycosyltransferase involved in cell wall biosynthesis